MLHSRNECAEKLHTLQHTSVELTWLLNICVYKTYTLYSELVWVEFNAPPDTIEVISEAEVLWSKFLHTSCASFLHTYCGHYLHTL